jgi:hypothetical protein
MQGWFCDASTSGSFRDVKNVLSGRAQRGDQRGRDAFVGEPARVQP